MTDLKTLAEAAKAACAEFQAENAKPDHDPEFPSDAWYEAQVAWGAADYVLGEAATPDAVLALYAERDEALAYVKDATVAITELTSGGSEFFGKRIAGIYTADLPFCVQRIRDTRAGQFEHIRKLARELKAAEASLAKRDEEVARLRKALEHIRNLDEADGHELTWQHASEAVGLAHQALTKEPPHAE